MAITSNDAPCPPGFQPKWRDLLERNVAIYRRLPEDLTAELEALIPWFIDKVKWSWHAGLAAEEKHKVTVASEACVVILGRSKQDYSKFKKIEIYPRDMKPVGHDDAVGLANQSRVRLGWYWAEQGMEDGEDNYNVVLHEFAHVMDRMPDNWSRADPLFEDPDLAREWKSFANEEFKDLCERWERKSGRRVVREYGTENMAEFFACSTEAFFERSEELQFTRPKLYDWMQKIYELDPAAWPARVTYADLHTARKLEVPVNQRAAEEERRKREREQEAERLEREKREREERLRWLVTNRTVTVCHPNGIPHLKYTLVRGKHDGLMQRWDERGNLREKTHYMQDEKHGPVVYFYASGEKELEGYFLANERYGVWQGWHEDGTLKYRSEYRDGELKEWKRFLEGGETKTFGHRSRFGAR